MLTADHIVSRHRKPVRQPRQYHVCACCSQPRFDQHNNRHNLQTDHRQERQKGTSIKVQSWRSSNNNHLRLSSTTYICCEKADNVFDGLHNRSPERKFFSFSFLRSQRLQRSVLCKFLPNTLYILEDCDDFRSTTSTTKITSSSFKNLHPS